MKRIKEFIKRILRNWLDPIQVVELGGKQVKVGELTRQQRRELWRNSWAKFKR